MHRPTACTTQYYINPEEEEEGEEEGEEEEEDEGSQGGRKLASRRVNHVGQRLHALLPRQLLAQHLNQVSISCVDLSLLEVIKLARLFISSPP